MKKSSSSTKAQGAKVKLMADEYTLSWCESRVIIIREKYVFSDNVLFSLLNIALDSSRHIITLRRMMREILIAQNEVAMLREEEINAIINTLL